MTGCTSLGGPYPDKASSQGTHGWLNNYNFYIVYPGCYWLVWHRSPHDFRVSVSSNIQLLCETLSILLHMPFTVEM